MEEFYISSDQIPLHAKLEVPEGKERYPLAIVFHGLTGHMEEEHIKAAAKTFLENGIAALRVELYGHGKSGGAFEKHTLLKWVNNALDVVEYAKNLENVTDLCLCGHSQGGLLVMILAGLYPGAFKAIVPMSPAVMIPEAARTGLFFGGQFDPGQIPDRIAFFDRELDGNYLRTAQLIHIEELIPKYKGKVLIIHGDRDEAVPLSCSVEAAKHYDDCRLSVIEGDDHEYTGHLDQVLSALSSFLREL